MRLDMASMESEALRSCWEKAGYELPRYSITEMRKATREGCGWVHFGSGNIFRAYHAALMDEALALGLEKSGIVVAEGFDPEIIEKAYKPYDNLSVVVTLKDDATVGKRVIGSVAEALVCCGRRGGDWERLRAIFASPALRMATFTITEKGYAIAPFVEKDILLGPEGCQTTLCVVAALLLERFRAGAWPLALVSTDNCSRNGEKLQKGILHIIEAWKSMGLVPEAFAAYAADPARVSFPWTMIDKITPRPDPAIRQMLRDDGFEDAEVVVTSKRSYVAPFVNTEECQYLVVEDSFPNGRPALERLGVHFTSRETVTRVEKMKVSTCLNPLHTAMSIIGCLLGHTKISEEMRDPDIAAYVRRLGYVEGLPVVTDPGIISPRSFLDDCVNKRFPNPFMPDTPQRIATDTSQKLAVRFGETAKAYFADPSRDLATLRCLPLALASWIRYLLKVDDEGRPFEPSPDPLLQEARACLEGVEFGKETPPGGLDRILARADIWGYDLGASPLRGAVVELFGRLNKGPGAVRRTLRETVAGAAGER